MVLIELKEYVYKKQIIPKYASNIFLNAFCSMLNAWIVQKTKTLIQTYKNRDIFSINLLWIFHLIWWSGLRWIVWSKKQTNKMKWEKLNQSKIRCKKSFFARNRLSYCSVMWFLANSSSYVYFLIEVLFIHLHTYII